MWGASFMFIKIQLDGGIAPVHVAWLRCILGAAALLAIVRLRGDRIPRDPVLWRHLVVVALLMNGIPFLLFAYGETKVDSLLAGIFNALTPLLTLLFSLVVLPGERPTPARIAGLVIGFLGVLVVLAPWEALGGGSLLGSLACIGAATCYGACIPYMRRHLGGRPESAAAISAVQVSIGAMLLVLAAPFGDVPDTVPHWDVFAAMITLGVLGTGVAYVLNLNVIREAGAQTASMVTYLVPVFAVTFGVLILDEGLTWHEPLGGLLIIAGIAVATRRARVSAAAAA